MKTVIYPVKDLGQAKALYGAMFGVEPTVDNPYYVGFHVDGTDIGLDPNGHASGMTGPLGYWDVEDVAQTVATLVAAGAQVTQDVKDVGGGKLLATVTDPDGNVIGLVQQA